MQSFENIKIWIDEIERYAQKNTVLYIAGTKSDMVNKICITQDMIDDVCKLYNLIYLGKMSYIQTSAKTNENINELFKKVIEQFMQTIPQIKNNVVKPVTIIPSKNINDKKCC